MSRLLFLVLVLVAACGGNAPRPATVRSPPEPERTEDETGSTSQPSALQLDE